MPESRQRPPSRTCFALTIFTSAFLLFQVQPLMGKYILPWFGGSPAVWTTCMLFFQTMLFAGYAYAHLISVRWSPRRQAVIHTSIVLAACCLLPIAPSVNWKPQGGEQPTLQIVLLLAASVGLPYFLLSSTGPLLQRWYSHVNDEASPYRLYALSNAGSLLALISYPFVVEPALASRTQAVLWSWSFLGFAACCVWCSVRIVKSAGTRGATDQPVSAVTTETIEPPSAGTRWLWFALAMAASIMLLATTNQVCLDVASVPFLWVLPLTLYLMTFIMCFESERWYSRRMFGIALGVSMAAVCAILLKGAGVSIVAQVVIYFTALFFCCMVCHGELVRLKPHPNHLTAFYLIIAAGGAGGGLFVGLIAPAIFPAYLELHVGILASVVLTLFICFKDASWQLPGAHPRWIWSGLGLFLVGITAALGAQASESINNSVEAARNFYGVLRVEEEAVHQPLEHKFVLRHGRILHGMQYVAAAKRREPTAYYGRDAGVGVALTQHRHATAKHVGVVGLGVGTVATYGQPGDKYRFYEINPQVVRLAEKYFTYLSDTPAEVEIVLGDARLSLEHETKQNFDVLVLDAFSGDAIPAHLLTREAFGIYLRHLRTDGILAIHISNLHFDLEPVVTGLARHYGLRHSRHYSAKNEQLGVNRCLWMLLSQSQSSLDALAEARTQEQLAESKHAPILWTDDSSNLFEILR